MSRNSPGRLPTPARSVRVGPARSDRGIHRGPRPARRLHRRPRDTRGFHPGRSWRTARRPPLLARIIAPARSGSDRVLLHRGSGGTQSRNRRVHVGLEHDLGADPRQREHMPAPRVRRRGKDEFLAAPLQLPARESSSRTPGAVDVGQLPRDRAPAPRASLGTASVDPAFELRALDRSTSPDRNRRRRRRRADNDERGEVAHAERDRGTRRMHADLRPFFAPCEHAGVHARLRSAATLCRGRRCAPSSIGPHPGRRSSSLRRRPRPRYPPILRRGHRRARSSSRMPPSSRG